MNDVASTRMAPMEARRRAARFPITTPVLFREHGESEWHRGSTVNISRLGVLVRAEGPLPGPGDAVDFILTLPPHEAAPASQVCCAGRVVRISPEERAGGGRAVAITIDSYAIGHSGPE